MGQATREVLHRPFEPARQTGTYPADGPKWLEFLFAKSILSTVGGKATMKLNYVIEFVGDMDRAVKFYRDVLGCR